MKAILTRLFNHEELTSEETKQILLNITKEMYPDAQIAALLTALFKKTMYLNTNILIPLRKISQRYENIFSKA